MSGLMNRLFNLSVRHDKAWMKRTTDKILSNTGAQSTMYQDLKSQEAARAVLFSQELAERETEDVLDRALLKAKHAKLSGVLAAPEYYRIYEKVESLKKLRFVEEYEFHQDKAMYEWIKYKVAAEIGGQEEQEAFALYEKIKIDEMGELKYQLLKESAPQQF